MPVILLFRHESLFSLAVIDRRQKLRDANRDGLDSRIIVIKDVRIAKPHRAHLDILASLALENLGEKQRPTNFRELYDAWVQTLSTQKLNEDFYKKLAWWYLWAVKEARFPQGGGPDCDAIGVIRLLTRLIFVCFIKERGLVPEALFDAGTLKTLLRQAPGEHPEDRNYYHAILQNLFFATLNVDMGDERRWAKEGSGMKGDYLISLVYRYKDAFSNPDALLTEYFANVPYLNGGLFECLDEALTDQEFERNPALRELAVKEGNGWVLRIDGFSRRPEARSHVPNKLFFGGTADAALNSEFETSATPARLTCSFTSTSAQSSCSNHMEYFRLSRPISGIEPNMVRNCACSWPPIPGSAASSTLATKRSLRPLPIPRSSSPPGARSQSTRPRWRTWCGCKHHGNRPA